MDYRTIIDSIESQIGSTRLMAVSKTRSLEEIMAVYDCGIRLFGENYVQEIVEKFSSPRPGDMEVHMIGHLQSNKVNKVVPIVDMIESIDSLELLKKVDSSAGRINKVMNVLLELNTSNEDSKSGFESEEELLKAYESSKEMKFVKVCGLMTMGPVSCDPKDKEVLTDISFKRLKKLYDRIGNLSILSMGMSQDYMIGVRNGSTIVRIGTKIFGERFYG